MKIYFFGKCQAGAADSCGQGIISFLMPDLGVMYRTRYTGRGIDCSFTAAIMAVKFVENNQNLLSKQAIELLTDSAELVEAVNGEAPLAGREKDYRDIILMYMKKYKLKLLWVPCAQNRAAQILPNLPPLRLKVNLNFDFGQEGSDSALSRLDLKPDSSR